MSGPSIERLRELLEYDPETGVLTWRVRTSNRIKVGDVAGCLDNSTGYRRLRVDDTLLHAHRVAWAMVEGAWPSEEIDHINGVRDDNRFPNLRDVTPTINMQNLRQSRSGTKTGLLGVSASRRGYRAEIRIDGRQKHLGLFDTPEQAHDAYLTAKRQLHSGNTL